MKKSEFIQKFIEIEKDKNENATITMSYISYLQIQKKLVLMGDIELE